MTPGKLKIKSVSQAPKPLLAKCVMSLYGTIIHVGGQQPLSATIVQDDGTILKCKLSREQAKKLGKRLFEEVGLRGLAEQQVVSGEIESFQIHEILDYRQTEPILAFDRLRQEFGSEFAKMESPEEFVQTLRE